MSETLPSLTANGQKLIDRLLTLPQGWVTAAMLAESIGVSRRTVLRELPSVEQWIAAAGYRFVRSPGQGLLLDEPPARREQMRALLNGSTVYAELPRRQRRQKLLGMLLQAREPMKTAALARELLVSESTLAADLDEIGQWVSSYAVTLHRRPGVGVWLKGEKLSCRRAAAALLQSSLTEEELQAVLRGNFAAGGAFAALLNTKIAERVWQVLQQFEQKEKLRLPDAGFLTLAIHCTLAVQQLREQGGSSAAVHPPENAAQRLGAAWGQAFGLTLPTEEVQYLEQYLAAYITGDDGEKWGAGEMYLRHLTGRLISEVERAMRVNFSGYVSLRDNLFTHLRPMLLRVREQIRMDNPQLDTIQREYPQLWAATRAACDTVEMELALPHIPDSEAAYLAMHAGYELKSISGFAYRGRIPDPQGGRLLFGARTRSGAAAQPRHRPCDCNRAARAGVSVDYGQSRAARAGPRPSAGCGAAAERHRADRHTSRAVCRLGGRRRPALHLSPHALDGADARPFMHPDCVQTSLAAGPD